MALFGISLDAVTTAQTGESIIFDIPKTTVGLQWSTTGSPDLIDNQGNGGVALELTADGENWFRTGGSFPPSEPAPPNPAAFSGQFKLSTIPVIGARAVLLADLEEGKTLTASVSAA